jgi:TolB-like protein
MERDEAGTHARLREIRERLFQPAVTAHGGHTVKTAGDGLLLEFGSADAALRCSIEVQRSMNARNAAVLAEERIDFRFGINLGDIIVDGTDIAGDGVNVASRLETQAEPGGICVSAAVREQVHGGLDVRFVDAGKQRVKNIARPIRIYRVELAARGSPMRALSNRLERQIGWRRTVGMAACAALLFVGPAASNRWVKDSGPPFMSVAVLPFKAGMDSDKVSADRLTQVLTTAIQHSIRPARVASSGLAAKYGSDLVHDPRRAGAELNVRYLVEGELQHAGDANAVNVRLVDATMGTQVWSGRLSSTPGTDDDSDMIARLSSFLGDALGRTESNRIARLPKSSTEAVDRLLRANALWRQDPSLKGTLGARPLYEEALRLDPNFAPALVGLGYTLFMQWIDDPNADRQRLARRSTTFRFARFGPIRTIPMRGCFVLTPCRCKVAKARRSRPTRLR